MATYQVNSNHGKERLFKLKKVKHGTNGLLSVPSFICNVFDWKLGKSDFNLLISNDFPVVENNTPEFRNALIYVAKGKSKLVNGIPFENKVVDVLWAHSNKKYKMKELVQRLKKQKYLNYSDHLMLNKMLQSPEFDKNRFMNHREILKSNPTIERIASSSKDMSVDVQDWYLLQRSLCILKEDVDSMVDEYDKRIDNINKLFDKIRKLTGIDLRHDFPNDFISRAKKKGIKEFKRNDAIKYIDKNSIPIVSAKDDDNVLHYFGIQGLKKWSELKKA